MARYIDVNALMKEIDKEVELADDWKTAHEIANVVKYFPTADVRENFHAHWEKAYGDSRFMCSVCKGKENVPTIMGKPIVWDFCPNCGAEMEENDGNN